MGFFNRKPARGVLPVDIVTRMESYGQTRFEGFRTFETAAVELEFNQLDQAGKERYVDELAATVIPVGGWAVVGGAQLLVGAMFEPEDRPSYVELMLVALQIYRDGRVSDVALSGYDMQFWRSHGGSGDWLAPFTLPAPEAVTLTPLVVGEERELARYDSRPDANRALVRREAEDRYVVEVDRPVDRDDDPTRVRTTIFDGTSQYDALVFFGANPLPYICTNADLEPFREFGRPAG
jgi:hypothetical protein